MIALITGCTNEPAASSESGEPSTSTTVTATPSSSTTTRPEPSSTTTTTPIELAPEPPYVADETEVLRDRKELGGRFAQALLTYSAGTTAEDHAAILSAEFGHQFSPVEIELLREAMDPTSDSVGRVRYVQMGGNRATSASLMVWVDIDQLSTDSERTSESRVLDVRIAVRNDEPDETELTEPDQAAASTEQLRVVQLASAGGPVVTRPDDLSLLAAAVVDNPAIRMPDSARWDIFAGHTTDTMLSRMLDVAEITDYSVLVLNRGHPKFVFATTSVSRHTVGEAMDVYSVGGQLVVESRTEGSPTWNLARELYDAGIQSIGSPWAFDGPGGRSFTDDVHQDHLHITGY